MSSPAGLSGRRDLACFVGVQVTGFLELLNNSRINIFNRLLRREEPSTRPQYRSVRGKLCIVTGANAGVGLEMTRKLYSHGAHVVMACRSKSRGLAALQEVQESSTPAQGCKLGSLELQELDLSSLGSVRSFARRWKKERSSGGQQLSLLCCNAGIMRMAPVERGLTPDGHELHLQVNHLGHWLLANYLVSHTWDSREKQRKRGHQQTNEQPEPCRVVFVTSSVHAAGQLKFDDIQGKKHYNPLLRYGDSKLMNVVSGAELQRRMDTRLLKAATSGEGSWPRDISCSCHPGIVQTDMAKGFFRDSAVGAPVLLALSRLLLGTKEAAVASVMHAATAPAEEVAGRYCAGGRVVRSRREAMRADAEAGAALWRESCKLTQEDEIGISSMGLVELAS